jgi:hypothetical protein
LNFEKGMAPMPKIAVLNGKRTTREVGKSYRTILSLLTTLFQSMNWKVLFCKYKKREEREEGEEGEGGRERRERREEGRERREEGEREGETSRGVGKSYRRILALLTLFETQHWRVFFCKYERGRRGREGRENWKRVERGGKR